MEKATNNIKTYYIEPVKLEPYCRVADKAVSCRIPNPTTGKMDVCSLVQGKRDCVGNLVAIERSRGSKGVSCPDTIHDRRLTKTMSRAEIEQECFEMLLPDWDKVAALKRKWGRSTWGDIQELVKRYQAGDESVLVDIEDAFEVFEVVAYSAAKKFASEAKTDTAVFINEAGQFDKYLPKAPYTDDPEDDVSVAKKMYVQMVPFSFSDEDIEEQFPKSVKAALKTYKPDHVNAKGRTTLFSTWFIRRFKLDLKSLYKKYKGDAEKIKNLEQYKEKGLTWSGSHVSIPDKTDLFVGDFTPKEADWMSLVLESYPYDLSVKLRGKLLNIDTDTDKNIRDSIAKKLGRWRMQTENRSTDTYLLPKSNGVLYLSRKARTRPPAEFVLYGERFRSWSYIWQGGRRLPRVSDGYAGDIVLNSGLLTVKGHADPTPAAAMNTEPLTGMELIPAPAYNWYRDKDGLRILPGVTGKCNAAMFVKDKPSEPVKPKPYFVYHHVVKPVSESLKLRWAPKVERVTSFPYRQKIYCKNEPTMGSLMLYRKELCERTARRIKERERRKAFAEWLVIMELNVIFRFFFE